MSCQAARSKGHCTCSYTHCDKHGNCCQCVVFHRERNELPGCFFTADGERTGDRSWKFFAQDRCL